MKLILCYYQIQTKNDRNYSKLNDKSSQIPNTFISPYDKNSQSRRKVPFKRTKIHWSTGIMVKQKHFIILIIVLRVSVMKSKINCCQLSQ